MALSTLDSPDQHTGHMLDPYQLTGTRWWLFLFRVLGRRAGEKGVERGRVRKRGEERVRANTKDIENGVRQKDLGFPSFSPAPRL